jgi:hypothetical protein
VQNHVVKLRLLQGVARFPRQINGAVTRSILVFFFSLSSADFAIAQQRETPTPAFSRAGMAHGEQFDTLSPPNGREDLPDAPDRPPLQARGMTFAERFQIYRRSLANPESAIGPALGAALGQANNEPPEWGQGASGYGARLASGYGRWVINRTIRFGVAALDHEDPRFTPTNESSVDYVMPRTDQGPRIPAFSRFAGSYGAAFIANAWYPESRANASHAMMRGSTSLAAAYAWHVFREFWPDIKKALHHPKDQEAGNLLIDREAPERQAQEAKD